MSFSFDFLDVYLVAGDEFCLSRAAEGTRYSVRKGVIFLFTGAAECDGMNRLYFEHGVIEEGAFLHGPFEARPEVVGED